MATKRTTLESAVFKDLPKQVGQARARAEKLIGRTLKDALELVPSRPRKVVKSAMARVEKVATDLDRQRIRTLKRVRKQGEVFVGRVEKSATDAVRRLERGAVSAVKPLVHRLDVASRHDVERLSQRIALLERRVARQPKRSVAA